MDENLRTAGSLARRVFGMFYSVKVAIGLIVGIAVVLASATILEASCGRVYSRWFVYHNSWFVGLLYLSAFSVCCAAYVHLPWQRCRAGFVLASVGFMLLLAGSVLTLSLGIDGQVELLEGQSTDQLVQSQLSQCTVSWVDRRDERPYVFTFDGGPVDWRRGTELNLGNVDGLRARVLNYYSGGRPIEKLVADTNGRGGPLIRFELYGSQAGGGHHGAMKPSDPLIGSLTDQDYGAELFVGPIALRLQRSNSAAMMADFRHPASDGLGEKGVLTAYYKDAVQRVKVDECVGQTVPVGPSGAAVELVQYLANAKLDANGQFRSIGTDVRNPLVELKVRLPGQEQPFRQVAFAKSPLLNFDGVYERDCPVRFSYQHPKLKLAPAIEFMQDGDGKLYGRTVVDGTIKPLGEMNIGAKVDVAGGFTFTVAEYLPHARREVSFQPSENSGSGNRAEASPAAQVEIAVAGVTRTVWLQRNDATYGVETLETPAGPLRVRFATARVPLGFKLELVDVQCQQGANNAGAASSVVRVIDPQRRTDDQQTIAVSQPISSNGFRIYQVSFQDAGHGKQAAILRVTHDPGRLWKYAGSLLLCLGIATAFCTNAITSSGSSLRRVGPTQGDDAHSARAPRKLSA